jgi:hypothetical protein
MNFTPLTPHHFKLINNFLEAKTVDASSPTATTLLGWQKLFNPQIHINDKFITIKRSSKEEAFYTPPLVKNREDFYEASKTLKDFGAKEISLALNWQAEILKELGFSISPLPSMAEYIYDTQELINLSGKKFHSKRNFVNAFSHEYTYRAYTKNDYESVMELFDKWSSLKILKNSSWSYLKDTPKMSDYDLEKEVVSIALNDLEGFNLIADVIEINGKIAAFAAGEISPNGQGVIHFEKGDLNYRGIFQLLDNLFIKERLANCQVINKQEDMGIEGLKRAKLSYHPIRLVERFVCVCP